MAENKATTLEQLRALAERGKLDTLNRVDQLLESIIPLLEGAQHSGTTRYSAGRELERQSSDCKGQHPFG